MSYDLLLKPKNNDFTIEKFEAYLKRKSLYSLSKKDNELNAIYENKSTDVNFYFNSKLDFENGVSSILFSLNYLKPSYFVKEADIELKKIIEVFDLMVEDPQMNGIRGDVYNSKIFIKAWRYRNQQACQTVIQNGHQLLSFSSEKIENVWQWNNNKNDVQNNIPFDVFVPSIMYVMLNGQLFTACVWSDGIPIVIPPVDIVVIVRKNILSKKDANEKEGMAIATRDDVNMVLDEYKKNLNDTSYYVFYKNIPFDIRQFIISLDCIAAGDLTRVSSDNVLDDQFLIDSNGI